MSAKALVTFGILLAATAVLAQSTTYPKAKVSFDDFKHLVAEVESQRASRGSTMQTSLGIKERSQRHATL